MKVKYLVIIPFSETTNFHKVVNNQKVGPAKVKYRAQSLICSEHIHTKVCMRDVLRGSRWSEY